jgi:hypothetical protein
MGEQAVDATMVAGDGGLCFLETANLCGLAAFAPQLSCEMNLVVR